MNQQLIDLVVQSRENYQCAFAIHDILREAEENLRERFWDALETALNQELIDTQMEQYWCVTKSFKDREVYVSAKAHPSEPFLKLGVVVESRLWCGVYFSENIPDPPQQIAVLRSVLPGDWKQPDASWWVSGYDSRLSIWDRDFLADVAADPLSVAQPMAAALSEALRKWSQDLIAANAALGRP